MDIASRTRWKIAALLCAAGMVNFFQRVNISVAGDSIMQDFHLSQTQMGTVFSAFVLGYTIFQVPGGMLADQFGPKRVLAFAIASWGIFTFLTGMIWNISLLTGISVLNSLIVLRFLFGIFQAPVFPASTCAVTNWFPVSERARANALALSGVSIGSFLVPPLVSWMILQWSWQSSFFIASTFSLILTIIWVSYLQDHPSDHLAVNEAELNLIHADTVLDPELTSQPPSIKSQLANGNLWRLVVSYGMNGYVSYIFVFWIFLYLKQVRHLSQAESGWLTTVAWMLAAVSTLVGGYLSDRLIKTKLGLDWGRRMVPMGCQVGAAMFLAIGARLENAYMAAAMLAICTGLILGVEGPYWAVANQMSGRKAGFTGGLMNTGSNFGGVISPTLTPFIAHYFGWVRALDFACVVAIGSALLWVWISPQKKPEKYVG